MSDRTSLRAYIEKSIRTSFSGVRLGDGISLRQAEVIDRYGEGCSDPEFEDLKRSEIVDDWTQIPFEELERDNIAHLDDAGFRYYLPALMLSLLDHYGPASMRVIGTLYNLRWLEGVDLLSTEQNTSVAQFLIALPELVQVSSGDNKMINEALEIYWGRFLPRDTQRGT
ncbi:MAG TPA: DUF6714 family protein [Gallionellaceae bacterium]|nr:DUF6714 family protein [Gallionellaceae bacterium]